MTSPAIKSVCPTPVVLPPPAEILSTRRVTGSVAVAAIVAITLALTPEVTPVIIVFVPVL